MFHAVSRIHTVSELYNHLAGFAEKRAASAMNRPPADDGVEAVTDDDAIAASTLAKFALRSPALPFGRDKRKDLQFVTGAPSSFAKAVSGLLGIHARTDSSQTQADSRIGMSSAKPAGRSGHGAAAVTFSVGGTDNRVTDVKIRIAGAYRDNGTPVSKKRSRNSVSGSESGEDDDDHSSTGSADSAEDSSSSSEGYSSSNSESEEGSDSSSDGGHLPAAPAWQRAGASSKHHSGMRRHRQDDHSRHSGSRRRHGSDVSSSTSRRRAHSSNSDSSAALDDADSDSADSRSVTLKKPNTGKPVLPPVNLKQKERQRQFAAAAKTPAPPPLALDANMQSKAKAAAGGHDGAPVKPIIKVAKLPVQPLPVPTSASNTQAASGSGMVIVPMSPSGMY